MTILLKRCIVIDVRRHLCKTEQPGEKPRLHIRYMMSQEQVTEMIVRVGNQQ